MISRCCLLSEVVACEPAKLETVSEQLAILVTSGPVGMHFFQHNTLVILSTRVGRIIDEDVEAFFFPGAKGETAIMPDSPQAAVSATVRRVTALHSIELLEDRREVSVRCGAVRLLGVPIAGVLEHAATAYSASLKAIAVAKGLLEPVACEGVLTGGDMKVETRAKLGAGVLLKPAACRARLNEVVGDVGVASSDKLLAAVAKQVQSYKCIC